MKNRTGGKVYYARNQQYSVVALLNASGSVVERYAYSAYGDLTVMNAAGNSLPNGTAFSNPYTYTGRRYDSETELYYFRPATSMPNILHDSLVKIHLDTPME